MKDDYSHVLQEQERMVFDALKHAEELGLTPDELHLLSYMTGVRYQPKEEYREMGR